ncbi:PrsW family intramembrane metalloprotease [Spelaeicoccus albus]
MPGIAGTVITIVGVVLLSILAAIVAVLLAAAIGPGSFLGMGLLALIPLGIVLLTVRWIDRWLPQPKTGMWLGFLWGSAAAVVVTLVLTFAENFTMSVASGGAVKMSSAFATTIQAPSIEEFAKGLGLLVLLWVQRRHFNGPLDGLVYAAIIAGGFAFTENILYFARALDSASPGQSLILTFVLRGIMGPFAHITFTSVTGLFLGIAARKTGPFGAIGFFVIGLIPAMILHGVWNSASLFSNGLVGYLSFYLVVEVPLFALWIVAVSLFRRAEITMTRRRLGEYVPYGWLSPAEVGMFSSWNGRRQALAWAKSFPGAKRKMRRLIYDAGTLAALRHQMMIGRGNAKVAAAERAQLAALSRHRIELLQTASPPHAL